ncbi:MAG: glycerol-3-phosphate 1-O-acyltransferase PlsY [Hyphomicrobiaceae bacterium]
MPLPVAVLIIVAVPYLAGYFIGSIPFGLLLSRLAGHGDVRATGSGNIGATNVLRHAGKFLGGLTLVLDLLKGTAGVLAGSYLFHVMMAHNPVPPFDTVENVTLFGSALGGIGAFLGHLYPVWLRFQGGKGVATLIGVLLGFDWRLAAAFCATWLATALIGRISSLSALVATALVLLGAWLAKPLVIALVLSVMSLLVFYRHSDNIRRLRTGEEPKIGARDTKRQTKGQTGESSGTKG